MAAPIQPLRPGQPADAPDAPGVAFSAWNYGHELARSRVAALVGTGAYVVLHAISSHANKQAQAHVGHARLAEETGLSRAMVKRHIATLSAAGAIGVHRRKDDETGVWETNLYTILPLSGIKKLVPTARDRMGDPAPQGAGVPGDPSRVLDDPGVLDDPTLGNASTLPPGVLDGPTLGNASSYKASLLSTRSISIQEKHPSSASPRTRPRAQRANEHKQLEAKREPGTKTRERACRTPEEEAEREGFLHQFGEHLRPVGVTEVGRFRNEALRAIRAYGYDQMCGCLRAMASSKRFVGQPFVSPVTIANNVLTWQEAGQPRSWKRVEEWAQQKASRNGASW